MVPSQPTTVLRPAGAPPGGGRTGLPAPRGELSERLLHTLARGGPVDAPVVASAAPLADEDLQLALYCCYELHYQGFAGVEDAREWDPTVLAFRSELEAVFVDSLATCRPAATLDAEGALGALEHLATVPSGPSLSSYLADRQTGTRDRVLEFLIHRSAYQLKEADPHTWAIPRLSGRAKAAMVEIQTDEYGGGTDGLMHAQLFADTLRSVGLDTAYGAYLDRLPAATLATVNLVSLFGLHRRWRGALVGHLALFEMTSVTPMGRYSAALRRLDVSAVGRRFYDVHVVADEHHQVVALDDLASGFLEAEPDRARDLVFGAAALSLVERRFTDHLLSAWAEGRSSLRT